MSPGCAQAYLLWGLADFQRGETAASIDHYNRAIRLGTPSYSAHYNLALAYLRQQNAQDARKQLEIATRLNRNQPDAEYDLGIVLLQLGEPKDALLHLQRAKVLRPQPDVSFNIVRAEVEAGNNAQAQAEAADAAKLYGADLSWNAAVGQIFLHNNQPASAAMYLERANNLDPGNDVVRRQLATAYLASQKPEAVVKLITVSKTSEDFFLLASAHYALHQFEMADEQSQRAIDLATEEPRVLALRTRLLQRAGRQNQALELAKRTIAIAPNWDEPYYQAGVSYYFIRQYDEAAQNLAKARELNPKSARTYFLEAVAVANRGNTAEAEERLRQAILLEPTNARLHCHLGILLFRLNKYPESEASLNRAIQLKPEYGLSHYELGKLLVYSKRYAQAIEQLEQAVARDPALGAAYYQLSRAYTAIGEKEKSAQALARFQNLRQQDNIDSREFDREVDEDMRKAIQSP